MTIEQFLAIEFRLGTIVDVMVSRDGDVPAYTIDVDFGQTIGRTWTDLPFGPQYEEALLLGSEVMCLVNQVIDNNEPISSRTSMVILGIANVKTTRESRRLRRASPCPGQGPQVAAVH